MKNYDELMGRSSDKEEDIKPAEDSPIAEYQYKGDCCRDCHYVVDKVSREIKKANPGEYGDSNIGYKLYLDVPIENIVLVSNYLKSMGFHHKHGFNDLVNDGETFVIYCGSKVATEKAVEIIENDIGDLLNEVDKSASENVCSGHVRYNFHIRRNTDLGKGYSRQKYFGFSLPDEAPTVGDVVESKGVLGTWDELFEYAMKACQRLSSHFGPYFGGGIGFYEKDKDKWEPKIYPWEKETSNEAVLSEKAISAAKSLGYSSFDFSSPEERKKILSELGIIAR